MSNAKKLLKTNALNANSKPKNVYKLLPKKNTLISNFRRLVNVRLVIAFLIIIGIVIAIRIQAQNSLINIWRNR